MGGSLKVSERSLLVWRMCQFLVSMFLMGGCRALKVVVKGVRRELVFGLSTRRDCLSISRVRFFWLVVFLDGYPRWWNLASMSLMEVSASSLVEQIFLHLRNWPYGILEICFGGWYDL